MERQKHFLETDTNNSAGKKKLTHLLFRTSM